MHRFRRLADLRLLAALGLGISLYAAWLFHTNNFHVVIPGVLYRSGQPNAGAISAYRERYGIRTIVNLRGASPGAGWYEEEVAASRRLGIVHVDFGMSAGRRLDTEKSARLIAILTAAAKPVLIHCKAGSDRTGLASALYLAAVAHSDEEIAEMQLSILYGHFSLPFTPSFPMNMSFEAMEPLLGFVGS